MMRKKNNGFSVRNLYIYYGKVKFWVDQADWADSKLYALFKIHQLSDIHK